MHQNKCNEDDLSEGTFSQIDMCNLAHLKVNSETCFEIPLKMEALERLVVRHGCAHVTHEKVEDGCKIKK